MDELKPTDPQRIGRYRITGRLGAGGMGRVYLGRSPSGRLVAVKVVRPELAEDPGFRDRFVREVAAARKVTGFFTAAVVDADPDASPPWLATAYVPGLSLDEAVAAHGPWPAESVRVLGVGVAEALEAIHAAGLIHRDLKPSNVLIAPDGPRVVDFGISVAVEATALTRTGTIVGTPGFMAPEQLIGASVTSATDVFALGAMLTYVATGTGPFGTGSAQALNFRIAYEEPNLAGLPSPGLEIIARCLAKEPDQRPKVADLIEELAPATPDDGYTPTQVGPEIASWLPDSVARALPVAATAPTATAPLTPPQPVDPPAPAPAPVPAPATAPPPAPRVRPTVPAPPARPSVLHRALPFWTAVVALALATFLPMGQDGWMVLGTLDTTNDWPFLYSWQFLAVVVPSFCSCVAVMVTLRRVPSAPVPRRARRVHVVTTTLTIALLFDWLFYEVAVGPGTWFFVVGGLALIYSTFQLPAPPHSAAADAAAARSSALHRAPPFWVVVTALALSLVLPAIKFETISVSGPYVEVWLVSVTTLLSACACAVALSALRRAVLAGIPHRARNLRVLTTTLTAAVLVVCFSYYVYIDAAEKIHTGAAPASLVLPLGCAVLIYSAFRIPAPRRQPAPGHRF